MKLEGEKSCWVKRAVFIKTIIDVCQDIKLTLNIWNKRPKSALKRWQQHSAGFSNLSVL